MTLYRRALLQTKEKPATQKHLLLVVTFNKNLSNIKNVIDKHWHILSINENFKKNLIKNRSLRIEEIKFTPNNRRQPHFEKQSL